MKKSKYVFSEKNHFVHSDKFDGLLYIGNSCSFMRLSFEQVELLKNDNFELLDKDLFCKLIELGALVESDEEILQKYKLFRMKNNNQSLMSFWVDITDCCNFSCPYCFQGQEKLNNIISKEVIDKFVKILSQNKMVNKLEIQFAGGEPLLATDKIIYLYEQIQKKGISSDYSIITNGYYLTQDNINLLDKIENLSYQITIDGLEENHNLRRPNKGKNDSFKVIMKNLETFYEGHKDKKINFSIRMNVDKANSTDVPLLHELLKKKFGNFFLFYVVPVEIFSKKQEEKNNCFSNKEYASYLISLYENYGIFMPNSFFPDYRIAGGFCPADRNYSYTLSSTGDLMKCPCDIGVKSRVIKNICNANMEFNYKPEFEYLIKSPLISDKKCSDCKLFFQCLGGCPHRRLNENNGICPPMYYELDKFLEIYYMEFLKKNKIIGGKDEII